MTTSTETSAPLSGLTISLTFWLMLAAAAGLFAAVSLSPKLAAYLALDEQFRTQQSELVELERQQRELERVIAALKDDPQFAAEMARLEFDAVRPGEEILSVESSLVFEPHAVQQPRTAPAAKTSPWRPLIGVLAYVQPLRTALLVLAASLVLLAFGWLHDRPAAN